MTTTRIGIAAFTLALALACTGGGGGGGGGGGRGGKEGKADREGKAERPEREAAAPTAMKVHVTPLQAGASLATTGTAHFDLSLTVGTAAPSVASLDQQVDETWTVTETLNDDISVAKVTFASMSQTQKSGLDTITHDAVVAGHEYTVKFVDDKTFEVSRSDGVKPTSDEAKIVVDESRILQRGRKFSRSVSRSDLLSVGDTVMVPDTVWPALVGADKDDTSVSNTSCKVASVSADEVVFDVGFTLGVPADDATLALAATGQIAVDPATGAVLRTDVSGPIAGSGTSHGKALTGSGTMSLSTRQTMSGVAEIEGRGARGGKGGR
jgi:hypothetical protein